MGKGVSVHKALIDMGRAKKVTAANGSVSEWAYAAISTDTSTGLGSTVTMTETRIATGDKDIITSTAAVNQLGQKIWVKDHNQGTVAFAYDAVGNLLKTTSPGETVAAAGRETIYEYDIFGRTTKITEPGNRISTTLYNAFGEIWKVTKAKFQKALFSCAGKGGQCA